MWVMQVWYVQILFSNPTNNFKSPEAKTQNVIEIKYI